jgi:hypothetical protein
MRIIYQLFVAYLTAHVLWCLFREKRFWRQAGIVLVLVMFLLRMFLVE